MRRIITTVALLAATISIIAGTAHATPSPWRAQHHRWANARYCPAPANPGPVAVHGLVVCEARLFGVVVDHATYVAHRESRYVRTANNGICKGVYQQHHAYWASRYRGYGAEAAGFGPSWYNARTNIFVSMKMVRAKGWGDWNEPWRL
jgi:hypothetical protein